MKSYCTKCNIPLRLREISFCNYLAEYFASDLQLKGMLCSDCLGIYVETGGC